MQYSIPNPNAQKTIGNLTYFGCATGELICLDWATGAVKKAGAHKDNCPISCIAVGQRFIYTGGWDKRIFRYALDTLEVDAELMFFEDVDEQIAHQDFLKSLYLSADGLYLYSGAADGVVSRWSLPQTAGYEDLVLKPLSVKLCQRFINSIEGFGANVVCGGSSRTLYVLDSNLKVVREHLVRDCQNITKIIQKGQLTIVLSKDVHILSTQLEEQMLFVMPEPAVDIYFPPNAPEKFYCACEDVVRVVKFEQSSPLNYYDQLAVGGRQMTDADVKALLKTKQAEIYETLPQFYGKSPCGFECAKQLVKGKSFEKECFVFVCGAHDEAARRIFVLDEDRKLLIEAEKVLKEEKKINLEDSDEDIEIDPEELEEIKHKRLKAMLDGSDTWHKDKF